VVLLPEAVQEEQGETPHDQGREAVLAPESVLSGKCLTAVAPFRWRSLFD
jgi:hypothetical protein